MRITKKISPFYLFLLVLVWKSSSLVQAQSSTHTGDILVITQAEVDALSTTLENIDTIDGNLTIAGSDITDLTPLSDITDITGDLTIRQNRQLANLNALNNLQSIGGYFKIYDNGKLTTLGDFTNLQTIGEHFWVYFNDKITTLGSFPALQTIGEYIYVRNNDKLFSLGDFPNLTSIGIGEVYISSLGNRNNVSVAVEENPNLVLCSWLEEFLPTGAYTAGDIHINNNATGCKTTEEVNNPVLFVNNLIFAHKDSTTTSFNIYASVRWKLVTSDDATWITSLSSDSNIHSSRITGENESTITLIHTRAPNATQRSTTLTLTAIDENGNELMNPATVTINFTQLPTIYEGDISLRSQEEVNELISNTTVILGNLIIAGRNITDLTPLGNMTHIMGNLIIQQNRQLVNLNGLNNLQSIGEYFGIFDNAKLTTLGDFSHLQSIGRYFKVTNNDKLLSLGSFPSLTSIGIGKTYVPSRYYSVPWARIAISPINNVSIVVERNPNLVLCSWLEEFLPTGANAVTGDIYIQGNATGCKTTEEINNRPPVLLAKNPIFAHKDSTTTSFKIYANVRWKLVTSDDATWITSLSSGSNTHPSHITGENETTITLIHTRAPNATPRSTILTLTAIDENGEELTNSATITINFGQLKVYEGDITLRSQEEVNEFISDTIVIFGSLTIAGSNITNLTPLSNMTRITGFLSIQQNEQLVNLNDLNNLQTIGGGFFVSSNALTTLGNFPALQSIGGTVSVIGNAKLTTLGNFPALQSIGGSVSVIDNAKLTTLGNFPALQTIEENFTVNDNNTLITLGIFPALQTIGRYFAVYNNGQLTSLGNFPVLISIGIIRGSWWIPSIVVENNSLLAYCCVLTKFRSGGIHQVSGRVIISGNAAGCNRDREVSCAPMIKLTSHTNGDTIALTHDDTLPRTINLTLEGSTAGWESEITYTPAHANFITLSPAEDTAQTGAITIIPSASEDTIPRTATIILRTTGHEGVSDSVSLTITQAGAPGPQVQAQSDTIYTGNIIVTTQAEVDSLRVTLVDKTIIKGNLTIGYTSGNSRTHITDLTPLSNIVRITGNLRIQQNGQLVNLNGLNNLQTILGYFSVENNGKLITLGDFSNLQIIGGGFGIENNGKLTDLGDFTALQSIGEVFHVIRTLAYIQSMSYFADRGGFKVANNAKLTTLGNFPALQTILGFFSVSSNNSLTTLGDFPNLQSIPSFWVSERGRGWTLSIEVKNNPLLAYCCVLTNFLSGGTYPVSGSVYISGNAAGCNSVNEAASCALMIKLTSHTNGDTIALTHDDTLPRTIQFTLEGSTTGWESEITYTPAHANFITLYPVEDTAQTGAITIIPSASEDTIPRTATITLRTTGHEGVSDSVSLTITQAGAPGSQVQAQSSTYIGNITVTTQAEVDSLRTTLANIDTIDGNLTIGYTSGNSRTHITDLTPLGNIVRIAGNLRIQQNGQLVNLNGLNNLQTILGFFSVENNGKLITLGDITALQTIGGDFGVSSNSKLTTLGNFSNLQSIGRNFVVGYNHHLTTLGNFSNLQTIGGDFGAANNVKLTTLGYFPVLQTIGRHFGVKNFSVRNFRAANHDQLTIFGNFPVLQTIGGRFVAINNSKLTTLGDFPVLQSIGEFFLVRHNGKLTTLGNFPALTSIGRGREYVYSLDERRSVSIVVEENPNLVLCSWLEKFIPTGENAVTGYIFINNNATGCETKEEINNLPTIKLTSHTNGDTIALTHDDTLPRTIQFTLEGSATGWRSEITYTPAHANFITLYPVEDTAQTGAITITATPTANTGVERTAMITLITTGIGTPVTQMVVITQGVTNTDTTILPLTDTTILPLTDTTILPLTDTTTLPPTDTTTLSTHTKESIFTFYPNPTKGTLTIEGVTGYLQMYIHDLVGREVMTYSLTPSKKTIDVSDLPSGMYVVTLQGEDKTWTEVLIMDN